MRKRDAAGDLWELVHENTLEPVKDDERVKDFRCDDAIVIGGEPPAHDGSTGRVTVIDNPDCESGGFVAQFYPTVYGLRWYRVQPELED